MVPCTRLCRGGRPVFGKMLRSIQKLGSCFVCILGNVRVTFAGEPSERPVVQHDLSFLIILVWHDFIECHDPISACGSETLILTYAVRGGETRTPRIFDGRAGCDPTTWRGDTSGNSLAAAGSQFLLTALWATGENYRSEAVVVVQDFSHWPSTTWCNNWGKSMQ
jgi:hypothetical protein